MWSVGCGFHGSGFYTYHLVALAAAEAVDGTYVFANQALIGNASGLLPCGTGAS